MRAAVPFPGRSVGPLHLQSLVLHGSRRLGDDPAMPFVKQSAQPALMQQLLPSSPATARARGIVVGTAQSPSSLPAFPGPPASSSPSSGAAARPKSHPLVPQSGPSPGAMCIGFDVFEA